MPKPSAEKPTAESVVRIHYGYHGNMTANVVHDLGVAERAIDATDAYWKAHYADLVAAAREATADRYNDGYTMNILAAALRGLE